MANLIAGIEGFLQAWDGDPRPLAGAPVRRSALGHRNLAGAAGAPAATFPRGHPQFADALEDGVRDLVLLLIERLGCITFSSCEGHPAADGVGLECGRSVDILPRDAAELRRLRQSLSACLARVQLPSDAVALRLCEGELETDRGTLPCLAIEFLPLTDSADRYFAALRPIYARLLRELETR